jgi:23S rRNA (adenine2030-N6)-methyltransferase
LARAALGPTAELDLWESDPAALAALRVALRDDPSARLEGGDGLSAFGAAIGEAEGRADSVVVLVDPPYTQKPDWIVVPDAFARAVSASTTACSMLWYPVKSLTRPNAMIARLAAAGVPLTIAELLTTPLDQQRRRLNGSGVVVVRPPAGALETIAAAAPTVGAACATQRGWWSFRMQTWPGHRVEASAGA